MTKEEEQDYDFLTNPIRQLKSLLRRAWRDSNNDQFSPEHERWVESNSFLFDSIIQESKVSSLIAELTKAKEENEALRKLLDKMANALGALQDCQNGPPLPTYEKDWNEAMKLTGIVLTEYDSLKQDSHAINTEPVVADRAKEK